MKRLQELYNEILASDKLKTAFAEAARSGKTLEFLKAQGCEATEEEVAAFLKDWQSGEVSDTDLEGAAGCGCNYVTEKEAVRSAASLGFGCAVDAIKSAVKGYVGQRIEECDGRLCN